MNRFRKSSRANVTVSCMYYCGSKVERIVLVGIFFLFVIDGKLFCDYSAPESEIGDESTNLRIEPIILRERLSVWMQAIYTRIDFGRMEENFWRESSTWGRTFCLASR